MKYPKFEPGQTVCFLAEVKHTGGKQAICSGVVRALWHETNKGWFYALAGSEVFFTESDLLNFTEAFGEYYEKNK